MREISNIYKNQGPLSILPHEIQVKRLVHVVRYTVPTPHRHHHPLILLYWRCNGPGERRAGRSHKGKERARPIVVYHPLTLNSEETHTIVSEPRNLSCQITIKSQFLLDTYIHTYTHTCKFTLVSFTLSLSLSD